MNLQLGTYNVRPFCVTVQEKPEKWEFIRKHFAEFGVVAESFGGISGSVSGLKTIHTYEADSPNSGWTVGPKAVATWLSFYMLWSAMNFMEDEYFWVLEWDCQFHSDWRERSEAALRNTPKDFDMLYLGSCCCSDLPKTHIAGEVFEVKYPQCGHSTIIAKKAIPTLLQTQRKVYAPLDISLKLHTLGHLKVFTVLPRIFDQFNKVLPD